MFGMGTLILGLLCPVPGITRNLLYSLHNLIPFVI